MNGQASGAKSNIDKLVDNLVGEKTPIPSSRSSEISVPPKPQKISAVYKSISIQTSQDVVKEKVEKITYNKSTQTVEELEDYEDNQEEEELTSEVTTAESELNKDDGEAQQEVTEEVVDPIAQMDDTLLAGFFNKSLKIINRVIKEDEDILKTYTNVKKDTEIESTDFSELVSLKLEHAIYSIDTSLFFPELLLVSIGKKILIYNSIFKKLEHQITTSTNILNVQFSKFQSNIIFATGYNGKVFSWNLELESNIPYLVSSANTMNHSYPVFALNQISENNGTLITASTDGKICTWSTSMLSKPISPPIELKTPKSLSLRFDELAPTSVMNLPNDHGFVIIGCEDGNIYRVKRFDNKISGNPDNLFDKIYQKHKGPISSLDNSIDFPNLFISSSFDWTVSLWDLNSPDAPLVDIYRNNAILQASWRPSHGTQIGFIHGHVFELLDLSIDSVIPILKIPTGMTLNKFKFDKNGSTITLGSIHGEIKVFEILLKGIESEIGRFKRLYVKS